MFITGIALKSSIAAEKKKNPETNCWYDASNTTIYLGFFFPSFFNSVAFFNSGNPNVRSFNRRLVKLIHSEENM